MPKPRTVVYRIALVGFFALSGSGFGRYTVHNASLNEKPQKSRCTPTVMAHVGKRLLELGVGNIALLTPTGLHYHVTI